MKRSFWRGSEEGWASHSKLKLIQKQKHTLLPDQLRWSAPQGGGFDKLCYLIQKIQGKGSPWPCVSLEKQCKKKREIYFFWFTWHQLPGTNKNKFKSPSNNSQMSQILQIWHVAKILRWVDTFRTEYQEEHEMKGTESEGPCQLLFSENSRALDTNQKAGGMHTFALRPSPHQSLVTAAHRDSKSLSPHLRKQDKDYMTTQFFPKENLH